MNELEIGLISARDECGKELLRIYLKYKYQAQK